MSEIRYFYVDAYTDETIPCPPALENWAAWLASEDPSWPHEIPADGQIFDVSTIDVVGTLTAIVEGGAWRWSPEPPARTELFVQGHTGSWDSETMADTLADCLGDIGEWGHREGDAIDVVCLVNGPDLKCRFEAAGPRLLIVGDDTGAVPQ